MKALETKLNLRCQSIGGQEMGVYDIIIIGCGPASVQLAVCLEELEKKYHHNINYIILEENSVPGSAFYKYPVHKRLISNNKVYTGMTQKSEYSMKFDWNSIIMEDFSIQTRDYSTDFYPESRVIPEMLEDIIEKYNIPIRFCETVTLVDKKEEQFIVTANKEEYASRHVVVATGFKLKVPNIKGCELATPYNKMKHKSYYRDKTVFIIGKGNSALECANDIVNEANMIICASPESIHFAYQTHYVGSPRIINAIPVENYQLKSLSAMLDCGYCSLIAFKNLKVEKETHLLITLEYGNIKRYMDNPLKITREPGVPEASLHLHPIIRLKGLKIFREIVLEENLFNKFDSSPINIKIIDELKKQLFSDIG